MLEKVSAAQVDNIMIKAASALRGQKARIEELETELARRNRRDHAEKIANMATDRGIMEEDEADDYAEKLASSSENLNMVEEFVGRAAAGLPLGRTLEKVASESEGGENETDVLTAFLLNSDLAG